MSTFKKLVTLPVAAEGEGGTFFLPIAALPSRHDPRPKPRSKSGPRALRRFQAASPPPDADRNQQLSPESDHSTLPDMDRGLDVDEVEYPLPPGRKKRKTPAYQLTSGRQDEFAVYEGDVKDGTHRHKNLAAIIPGQTRPRAESDDDEGSPGDYRTAPSTGDDGIDDLDNEATAKLIKLHRKLRPSATQTCEFRKLQFLRRKAALITLFLDATSAIKTYWTDEKSLSSNNISKNLLSKLPEVEAFEKLLPALEDVGVGDWPADKPTWRKGTDIADENDDDEREAAKRRLGVWRAKFAKRQKVRETRKEVIRGGWAPEGSFEFERSSKGISLGR